jgi:hypothetical protein
MTKNLKEALAIAEKFNIKVILKDPITPDYVGLKRGKEIDDEYETVGQWDRGRTIYINPRLASAYTVLHEIGHVFNGLMCCREHCEFVAHGTAIALAKVYHIKLSKDHKEAVYVYANQSNCPMNKKKRKKKSK